MSVRWYWAVVVTVLGVLVYFATDKLTETPPTWFDEGVLAQVAMNDSLYGREAIQVAPGTLVPATYVTGGFSFLKPISWSFSLTGIGLLQARSVMVFFILAAAGVFFYLLHTLHGRISALSALILLAAFPPLYGQGKNVLGEVPGLFFLGSFLLLIFSIEKNGYRGAWRYVFAGIFAGLTVVTKPIFIMLPAATLVAVVLRRKQIQFNWSLIGVATMSFMLPLFAWYLGRFALSDSFSQLITYYANPYSIENISEQMLTNLVRFFTEASPAYFAVLMTLWATAYAMRAWRRENITFAETIVFIFALLVSVAYLRTPGWYRYFFLAEVPALLFAPYSIIYLSRQVRTQFRLYATSAAWALLTIFLSLQLYQLFVGSWVAQHSERTTTRDIAAYMQSLPDNETYFVYNSPASVIFLPSKNYYQYLVLNENVHLGAEQLTYLENGAPRYLVTDYRTFDSASTTLMRKYRQIGNVDTLIVAESEAR